MAGSAATSDYDLRNYKCVPLDLLRNVNQTNAGEYEIQLTSDAPTLRDFKETQRAGILRAGPSSMAVSADTIENLMTALFVIFFIILFATVFYMGFLNFRAQGVAGFALPSQLKSMPVIGIAVILSAVLFGVGGFFIGASVK